MATIRSLTYPLTVVNGTLGVATDFDVIKQNIFSVLETRPGERVMQYTYGTPDFVFDAATSASVVAERVRISLESQIPEAGFEVYGDVNEDGTVSLTVEWSIGDIPQPPINYRLVS